MIVMPVAEAVSTEQAILDAADRMIGRYGLRKTTMEDVAREAGFSRGTVYGYFRSKQDLALASIDRVVMQAHEQMDRESRTGETPAERLYRMLVARVAARIEKVRDSTQSLDTIFAEVRPAYMQRRRAYFDQEARMLAEVIEHGQRMNDFGTMNALETAQLFVEATNAYIPYSLSLEELQQPGDLQGRIEKMAAILVAGISR
ncbi:MAG: TetR/AcrR family transcriptional regulator [Armatimonadetes bacterium]|nr:TetR/AcrR family transcriptional regulator [Armatimonadota bacterium]